MYKGEDWDLRESRAVDTRSLCFIAQLLVWSIQMKLHTINREDVLLMSTGKGRSGRISGVNKSKLF